MVTQRPVQPALQQTTAHGGGGFIHNPRQRVLGIAFLVDVDFQIAAAGRVNNDGVVGLFHLQRADMRQAVALSILGVMQQRAGRADGDGHLLATKTAQVAGFQLGGEQAQRAVSLSKCQGARVWAPCRSVRLAGSS